MGTRHCLVRISFFLLFFVSFQTFYPCQNVTAQHIPAPAVSDTAFDSAIQRARNLLLLHMETTDVPGMQVAVWKKGNLIWSEGFGWADVENRAEVTPQTRFPIASVSKSLTAVVAARLVDRGLLDMDADVRTYVPRFPWDGVTSRMLGQHLSGIRHYQRGERPGTSHYNSVNESLDIFIGDSLLFEPGTRYSYSSYGYNLLSAVMETASGKEFLTLVEEELVQPLGLTGTMANETDRLIPFRTQGYTMVNGNRQLADIEDPSYKWSGGGLLSTSEDLAQIGAAVLKPGYLSEDALSLLFTEGEPDNRDRTFYGFGWLVYQTREGQLVYSHNGNLDYGRSHLTIFPDSQLVVAILANTGTSIFFNDGEAVWLSELFLQEDTVSNVQGLQDWVGIYNFDLVNSSHTQDADGEIRSAPVDTVQSHLSLYDRNGSLHGFLTIGTRTRPVTVATVKNGTLELISIPTWRKIWITPTETNFQGRWERAGLPSGRLWLEGKLLNIRRKSN